MKRQFLTVSSAICALSMAMLVADPAFAQRGGRGGGDGGGGGNRDGGGGNRDDGGRSNRGGGGGSRPSTGGNYNRSSDVRSSVKTDGGRSGTRSNGQQNQVRVAPSPSNPVRDVQRDVNRDINRDINHNINRDNDRWTRSNPYSGNNQNRNQWNGRYPNQGTGNYPNYRNFGNYGTYGNNYGMYGNSFARPYTYYGNFYGSPYGYGSGYGSGLSNLIGLATGLGGFGVPGIGLGYGGGYGYGYGAYSPFGYNSGYGRTYSSPYLVDNSVTTQTDTYVNTPDTSSGDFVTSGRAAFLAGNYAEAQRQANHAVIDSPQDAKAHELMMLSLFAQSEFQGATAAAHALADLGQVPGWSTLYGYYKDRDKYVSHLGKLQQFVKEHPDAPEGRFLLGLNYQMIGDKNPAAKQFAEYIKLVHNEDPIAVNLFGEVGGDVNSLPKPEPQLPVKAPTPATDDGVN